MGFIIYLQNTYRDRVLDKVFNHQYSRTISRRLDDDEMPLGLMFQQFAESPEVAKRMMRMAKLFGLNKQQLAHPNTQGRLLIERCNTCRMRSICFTKRNGKMKDKIGFDRERCANIETYREIAQDSGKRSAIHHGLNKRRKPMPRFSPETSQS